MQQTVAFAVFLALFLGPCFLANVFGDRDRPETEEAGYDEREAAALFARGQEAP